MSIDDELQHEHSITDIRRALDLFTDRLHERRHFASYLNDPARKKILFFHGDGGNGKSWLLHMLRDRYCRKLTPESWNFVQAIEENDEFAHHFDERRGSNCGSLCLSGFWLR